MYASKSFEGLLLDRYHYHMAMQYQLDNDSSTFLPLIQAINTNIHRFHKKYMV
jgi:hypothetical protein